MTDEKEEKKEPVQAPAKVEVPKAQDIPVEPEVVVEDKSEEPTEKVVWGERINPLPPEESPLNSNGYSGVDPNFQRGPLSE